MRGGRRFILGFLLLVTLASLGIFNVPLAYADAVEKSTEQTEAVVDTTGDVQVEEPESPKEATADVAAEAVAQEAAGAAAAEAAAAKTAEVADEEAQDGFVEDVSAAGKSKAMSFIDKAKEVTPEKLKKVAAGAIGIWGVAAGAGWVMNNLGGAEE